MSDTMKRLRACLLDKDNCPRMDSERWLPVGLAREALEENERLRTDNKKLEALVRYYLDALETALARQSWLDGGKG